MYKKNIAEPTSIKVNKSMEGETIERKVERVLQNKESIKDGAPQVFTERKDGVEPQYDIRTDRMELALEVNDKRSANQLALREARNKLANPEKPGEVAATGDNKSS